MQQLKNEDFEEASDVLAESFWDAISYDRIIERKENWTDEQYKNEKAEYSVNRAGEYGNANQTTVAATVADTTATIDTTTVK